MSSTLSTKQKKKKTLSTSYTKKTLSTLCYPLFRLMSPYAVCVQLHDVDFTSTEFGDKIIISNCPGPAPGAEAMGC